MRSDVTREMWDLCVLLTWGISDRYSPDSAQKNKGGIIMKKVAACLLAAALPCAAMADYSQAMQGAINGFMEGRQRALQEQLMQSEIERNRRPTEIIIRDERTPPSAPAASSE